MNVGAIILAAGASRRLGQPKQLLRIENETLLARALRLASESGANPVIAVLGAYYEIISAAIAIESAMVARNNLWEQGIATSLHAGLDLLDRDPRQTHGALILTCDQPRLMSSHLHALIESFQTARGEVIVASQYGGILGVPAVFPRSVFQNLRALHGDQGARSLLAHPPCPLVSIEFPGGEIDIDAPEDLAHLR